MNSTSSLSQKVLKNKYKPLFQFFIDGIKDLYWAEKAIETLLKKNKSLAYTEELSDAIEDHEQQTHKHVLRLEKIFHALNMKPEAKKCEAMAGIIKEAEETVATTPENSMTRDAVIIICAQKVEHYEIASYGGLLQIALTFNMESIADLLEKTLLEEEETDLLLSDIAESYINLEAAEEDDDEDNDEDDKNNKESKGDHKNKSTSSATDMKKGENAK
ncbi:MAG: ferritin-like domain-containing protein [Flavobacteriia bacterium]|nr:ferritin-like domain-containing protein [Flavobacteriia bacterium]OJX39402.1 MAG: hypothetical protein BGO87_05360 [Flavobacteriia bacterium 40-80]